MSPCKNVRNNKTELQISKAEFSGGAEDGLVGVLSFLKKKNGIVSVQGTVHSTSKPVSIVCMKNESVSRSVISDSL